MIRTHCLHCGGAGWEVSRVLHDKPWNDYIVEIVTYRCENCSFKWLWPGSLTDRPDYMGEWGQVNRIERSRCGFTKEGKVAWVAGETDDLAV